MKNKKRHPYYVMPVFNSKLKIFFGPIFESIASHHHVGPMI
jgi:hypothetical protein